MEKTILKFRRLKRAIDIYKILDFDSNYQWVLKLDNGLSRFYILANRTYKKPSIFKKIEVAWLLAWDTLITNDGIYKILSEDRKSMMLYKLR